VFLGYQVSRQQNISEETSRKIDGEIRGCRGRLCRGAADTHRQAHDLETLAKGLLEFETLTGDESRICSWQAADARIRDRADAAGSAVRPRQAAAAPGDRGLEPQPQA